MFNFNLQQKAFNELTAEQFRVVYFFNSTLSMINKKNKTPDNKSFEMYNGYMCDKLGIKLRMVQYHVKELEKLGYISVERPVGKNAAKLPNIITLKDDTNDAMNCAIDCAMNCAIDCTPNKEEINKNKNNIINTTAITVPVPIEKEKINKKENISTVTKKEKVETSNGPIEDNNFDFIDWDEFNEVPNNEVPNKNNNLNSNNMEKTNMVPLKTDEKQSETGLTSLATALDKKEIIKEKAAAPLAAAAKSQEAQNKPHDGLKNDAVEQLPTNDDKTQPEARKYIETLTQRIYHEKNVENFKKLHDEYIAEMKNYKARYGTDNFVIKQKNWYCSTRAYFPKKKIDSNINSYFTWYKENFNDVKTANQLAMALVKIYDFMEKLKNDGYDTEKLKTEYNMFLSSQKRKFKDIWGTWN